MRGRYPHRWASVDVLVDFSSNSKLRQDAAGDVRKNDDDGVQLLGGLQDTTGGVVFPRPYVTYLCSPFSEATSRRLQPTSISRRF
jgi:hypothetical protein